MSAGIKAVPIGNGQHNAVDTIYAGTTQVIAVTSGASAALSSAFGSSTKVVRVAANVGCYVTFGASPAATASTSVYLPANHVELFAVVGSDKVSIKDAGVTGVFSVTEAISA